MHWPQAIVDEGDKQARYPEGHPKVGQFIMDDSVTFNETWAEMEKVYKAGKVRAIGVSNFSVKKYVFQHLIRRSWILIVLYQ